MAFTINGTTGLTFPDATTQATRAVSRSGDTMTGNLNVGGDGWGGGGSGVRRVLVREDSTDSTFKGMKVLNAGSDGSVAGVYFQGYDWVQGGIWHGRGATGNERAGALVLGTNPNTTDLTETGLVGRIVINNAGYVRMPAQPCVFAQGSNSTTINYGANGRITDMTTDGTQGSFAQGITHSAGVFTVPIAGKYMWTWTYYDNDGSTAASRMGIRHNGTMRAHVHSEMSNGQLSGSVIFNMAANDYVDFSQIYSTGIYMGSQHWYCSGQLIA